MTNFIKSLKHAVALKFSRAVAYFSSSIINVYKFLRSIILPTDNIYKPKSHRILTNNKAQTRTRVSRKVNTDASNKRALATVAKATAVVATKGSAQYESLGATTRSASEQQQSGNKQTIIFSDTCDNSNQDELDPLVMNAAKEELLSQIKKIKPDLYKIAVILTTNEMGYNPVIDSCGGSLLHHAASRLHVDVVAMQLKNVVNVNYQQWGNADNTALHCVAKATFDPEKSKAITTMLLAKGAVATIKNRHGQTALHVAVANNNLSVAKSLISSLKQNSKDLNERDLKGNAPIFYVNSEEMLKLLLGAGADPRATDGKNNTILDVLNASFLKAANKAKSSGEEAWINTQQKAERMLKILEYAIAGRLTVTSSKKSLVA